MSSLFQKDSHTDWQARIIKELKGRPYEDLVSQTRDGIEIQPFYTARENASVLSTGPSSPWRIRQEFINDDEENNSFIHEALMAGVDSISVDAERLEEDLDGVNLEIIEIEVGGEDFHPLWMEELYGRDLTLDDVRGGYAWDPYGGMLLTGDFEPFHLMPTILKLLSMQVDEQSDWYLMHVCGDNYHNAGATVVQELAFSISQMNLCLMYEPSLAPKMALTLAAGTDYFETACKFRAMRILWANLMRAHKQKCDLRLFARSATKDHAPVDQHSNLLRATAQSMAAIAGGAERITLLPFDGKADGFSYRMARNIQNILIHESYLDKSLNPMEGAYLFEKLTTDLATAAWDKFNAIESFGGWGKYCFRNRLQDEVRESAEQWAAGVNSSERTWLGVNKYADPEQKEWKGISVVEKGKSELGMELPSFENKWA